MVSNYREDQLTAVYLSNMHCVPLCRARLISTSFFAGWFSFITIAIVNFQLNTL